LSQYVHACVIAALSKHVKPKLAGLQSAKNLGCLKKLTIVVNQNGMFEEVNYCKLG